MTLADVDMPDEATLLDLLDQANPSGKLTPTQTLVTESPCWQCGVLINCVDHAAGWKPVPGDYLCCAMCGALAVYSDRMEMLELTAAMLAELDADLRAELLKTQRLIQGHIMSRQAKAGAA